MSAVSGISSSQSTGSLSSPLLSAKPRATTGSNAAGGTSGTSSGTSANSVDSLGATFMSLLAQELQNQDPTQPMDSTEMVGQMISLNQLDQVASINELLTNQLGSPAAAGTAGMRNLATQTTSSGPAQHSSAVSAANVPTSLPAY